MLGWFVEIHRQTDGGAKPAAGKSALGTKLFLFHESWDGLDWVDKIAQGGKAIDLMDGGYPTRYTAKAGDVFDHLDIDHPEKTNWTYDEADFPRGPRGSKAYMNRDGVVACSRDEWLIIDAWDES
ncbi:MAG TPA: hypothetical protein VJ823_01725 [Rhodanobacteraceae bacterium]|nr:hypothetical protein [Rhodanobacteraceae bacterium]